MSWFLRGRQDVASYVSTQTVGVSFSSPSTLLHTDLIQRLTFVALRLFPEDIDLMTCKRTAFWTVVVAMTLTSSVVQAAGPLRSDRGAGRQGEDARWWVVLRADIYRPKADGQLPGASCSARLMTSAAV